MEDYSNNFKILCTLKRIATQLDNLVYILSNGSGVSKPIPEEDQSGEIRFRVRKASYDWMSQVAATYSLERAIQLCPPGYSVYDAETDEVMFKNLGVNK